MEDEKALAFLDGLELRIEAALSSSPSLIEVSVEDLSDLGEIRDQFAAGKHPKKEASSVTQSHSGLPQGFFDNPLALTSKDIEGLPDVVLDELNALDSLEIAILELFTMAGGTLILDKIIAGLYHLTGTPHSRTAITAKLYRMSKKALVYSVPKKKGLYTTNPNVSVES